MIELFQEVVGWLGYLQRGSVLLQLLSILLAVFILGFVQRSWPVSGKKFWVRRWAQLLILGSLGFGLAVGGYPFRLILEFVVLLLAWYGLDGMHCLIDQSVGRSELRQLETQVIRPIFLVFFLATLLRSLDSLEDLSLIPVGHWFGNQFNLGDLLMALSVAYLSLAASGFPAKVLASFFQSLFVSGEGSRKANALIIRYLLVAIGLLWSLHRLGMNGTTIVAVAGGLSLGIGFGMKEIASNFISGLWMLFEGSVRPGEKLSFDGEVCEVRYQNLRATTLWREADNAELVIPNQTFFANATVTYTRTDPFMRCEVKVPVPPDQDPSVIMALMQQSAASIEGVLSDPPPQALLLKIGDTTSWVSSIFALRFMIDDPINQPEICSAVQAAIWQILSAKGLASLRSDQAPQVVDLRALGMAESQTTAPNQ